MANRPDHVDGADRRHQIFAHAAPCQLAVQRDVVDAAHDDNARSGIAMFGQLVESIEYVGGACIRFNQDNVWRRRAAESLDRGSDTAHLDFDVGLRKTPIFPRGLDCGCAFNRLAEGL